MVEPYEHLHPYHTKQRFLAPAEAPGSSRHTRDLANPYLLIQYSTVPSIEYGKYSGCYIPAAMLNERTNTAEIA